MNIVVSGSTGLIGSFLVPHFIKAGHPVRCLVRSISDSSRDFLWDPEKSQINLTAFEGQDAVIHLAGENLAEGRWTREKKQRIQDSRVKGTAGLSETLAALSNPPRILISASAVGYYGDRGNEKLTEESGPGTGFLADVCREWEAATRPAEAKGVRVVHARMSLVLSSRGGALGKMLTPFKLGVGGKIGSGEQYWSWISIEDIFAIFQFVLDHDSIQGALNCVSPMPVSNAEFTATLGHVLRRPAIFPMPALAARLAFGEMADEMLLVSQRAFPARLLAAGYPFRYPDLEGALYHAIGK